MKGKLTRVLFALSLSGLVLILVLYQVWQEQMRRRDLVRKSDLARVQESLENYFAVHNSYPASSSGMIVGCPDPFSECSWDGKSAFRDEKVVYLNDVPRDSVNVQSYFYRVSEDRLKYQLFARLENKNDSQIVGSVGGLEGVRCGSDLFCNFAVAGRNTGLTQDF